MTISKKIMVLLLGAGIFPAGLMADDPAGLWDRNWPQWRGPSANGVAPHGDPPVRWSEETHIKWKVRIPGTGLASPIVWTDQVFVLTSVDTGRKPDTPPEFPEGPPGVRLTKPPETLHQSVVLSIDRETGRIRWRQVAGEEVPHEGHHPDHGYASASPVTDGRRLYASFGSRGLFCYDLEGRLEWKRDLGAMFTRRGWGEGSSPALHGGLLAVNWDHEGDSFIAVLDADTGKTRWKAKRNEVTSWSTPLIVEHEGIFQLIVNATRRATGYNLDDGKIIWECGGQTVNAIPSPVADEDRVYCMSGYRGKALFAIPLDGTGDLTGTDRIAWQHDRGTPYVPSPLLYGNLLYFTESNTAKLSCLDTATGKPHLERQELPGVRGLYTSPVGAAGRIYFVGRDGTTLVIRNKPELEVLATNKLDDKIDASPAIAGKEIFIRGKSHLYSIASPPE